MAGRRAAARRARRRISFEDMAARRAERLVNLVICLLSTRQFLTRGADPRRRARLRGRPTASEATDEAFKRMFERDKAELRDLGIPLETGRNSHFDSEDGYRITRRDYELPPIEFDAAEAAAVGLAARLWQSATLGEPARNALIKLRAGGTDVAAARCTRARCRTWTRATRACPRCSTPPARAASSLRLPEGGRATIPERRTLEPWGVLSWRRALVRRRASTATAASRAASGCPGSSARSTSSARRRVRAAGDVDLLEMVAGRGPDDGAGRAGSAVTGAGAGRSCAASRESEIDGVLTIRFTDMRWLARHRSPAPGRRRRCSTRPISSTRSSRDCSARRRDSVTARAAHDAANESGCRGCWPSCRTCRRARASAIATAAADFGVTEEQLRRDLQLLWMCGLPGHGPGDLIDLSFEGETVSVIFDAGMSRPLRLTAEEALALVVALRTLAETPGPGRQGRRAAGAGQGRGGRGRMPSTRGHGRDRAGPGGPVAAGRRSRAVDESGRCGCATTPRPGTRRPSATVDPLRVFDLDGHAYLEAWCRRAEGHAGLPGRPHRGRRGCSTSRPGRRQGPAARSRRGRVPAGVRASARRVAGIAGVRAGSPTTTRPRTSRNRRTAPARSACGCPSRPGCARSCSARADRSR